MPSRRQSRINELLRSEISDLIRREVNDPRLATVVSITEIKVSPDLSSAQVYVSILGDDTEKKQTLEGLLAASPFLRRRLMDNVALRHMPYLSFHLDDRIEEGARILALLKENEEAARRGAEDRRRPLSPRDAD